MAKHKAPSRGVIYVAIGNKYAREAVVSINTLREHMPKLPVTVFTNDDIGGSVEAQVEPVPNDVPPKLLKMLCMLRTPYVHTLYIDADTFICDAFEELFGLLSAFDVATAISPQRITKPNPRVPLSFPEVNGGVILYRNSAKTRRFISLWKRLYEEETGNTEKRNEPSLRQALYSSQVRLTALSPEYNLRIDFPNCIEGTVKILHGRSNRMEEIARSINSRTEYRVYTPIQGLL